MLPRPDDRPTKTPLSQPAFAKPAFAKPPFEKPPFEKPAPPKPLIRPDDAVDLGKGAWAAKSAVVFTFSRSSGPGGQNVNKVNTRAELHLAVDAIRNLAPIARARLLQLAGAHLVKGQGGSGSLHFTAEEHRSQFDNREACIERLRELITTAATIPKKRKKTKPSRGAVQRRIESKKKDGAKKQRRTERFE